MKTAATPFFAPSPLLLILISILQAGIPFPSIPDEIVSFKPPPAPIFAKQRRVQGDNTGQTQVCVDWNFWFTYTEMQSINNNVHL